MSALMLRSLNEARERLRSGDIESAQALCRKLLERAPRNPDILCLFAVTQLAGGHPLEAIAPLELAIAAAPLHGMALENLGLAHLMLGRFAEAERALSTAAAVPGAPASVRMRLGISLLNQDRPAEALAELQLALAGDGQNPDIHLNLARAFVDTGDSAHARQHLEHVLRQVPDHADALFNLGVVSLGEGALDEAQQWFERALRHAPQHADALINLGLVHEAQHRPHEASVCYRRAIESAPAMTQGYENLGRLYASDGRHELAREQLLIALQLDPGAARILQALAVTCRSLGRFREGVGFLREVLRLEPQNLAALNILADTLFETGELDEALALAQDVIARDPTFAEAYLLIADIYFVKGDLERGAAVLETGHRNTQAPFLLGKLTYALRRLCKWESWNDAWPKLEAALAEHPGAATPFSVLCEPLTPARQLAHARAWSAAEYAAFSRSGATIARRAHTPARLRIGYLSSDFYEHATAYLLAEVLELHDRGSFEIFAYSYGPDDRSPMRTRLVQACEHFVDVASRSDDAIARLIQNDAIDVLIDLKGYTLGSRTGVAARRPCPVQVSWIGYPGTMGASFIDYLIADPFIIPPELESAYAERVLRLPNCYQPNDRKRQVAAVLSRNAYSLPEEGFVFCCFNQAYKITPDVFASWMRMLQSVPGSVLWLLEDNRWAADNLRIECERAGVAAARLIYAPRMPLAQHLARYAAADLALDTFPYGSHTTASDALWSGCPLLALCGGTFASRVSGSILKNSGLSELITYNIHDYEKVALRIASDRTYADSLRKRMAELRNSTPLFDSRTFIRDLEKIYLDLIA